MICVLTTIECVCQLDKEPCNERNTCCCGLTCARNPAGYPPRICVECAGASCQKCDASVEEESADPIVSLLLRASEKW